jgi:hypothetical protein
MIFVLSAMVGYLYWQQTRINQNVQSLSIIVSTLANPPQETVEVEEEVAPETQAVDVPVIEEEEEDDRVSVEQVSEPPPPPEVDVDDLHEKTSAQLRELLTQKGIPFGKRDSKNVLIELLKATA